MTQHEQIEIGAKIPEQAPAARRKKPVLEPHDIWWRLLLGRIDQVREVIPPDLVGHIQFEIARHDSSPTFFHLAVDGPRTVGYGGVSHKVQTWVETTEEALSEMLDAKTQPNGTLRTHGDQTLLPQLLESLAGASRPSSPLDLRCQS